MDRRVSLITLGVSDLERAAQFYEALGWARVKTDDEGIVAFDLLSQVLGLYPLAKLAEDTGISEAELGTGAITLSHNVGDRATVDALMERAKSAGAEIVKPAHAVFWGGYGGYFRDPDGHVWEVAQNPFSTLGPNGEFRWGGY